MSLLGRFKPARSQAAASKEDDVLCDLDVVLDTRTVVVFGGKTHAILPVTTKVFLDFCKAITDCNKRRMKDSGMSDEQYLAVVRILCPSLTIKDIGTMTIVQRGLLLNQLSKKVTGDLGAAADPEKKTLIK